MKFRLPIVAFAFAALLALPTLAFGYASDITYNLNVSSSLKAQGYNTTSFGTIQLTLKDANGNMGAAANCSGTANNSCKIHVTVTGSTQYIAGKGTVTFKVGNFVAFNVKDGIKNYAGIDLTSLPSGWHETSPICPGDSNLGNGCQGPFGIFDEAADGPDSGVSSLSFDVKLSNTSTGFTDVTQLVEPNSAGYIFATEVYVGSNKYDCQSDSGYAGSTPPGPVPEPGSFLLLGSGLSGVGFLLRKKFTR